MAQYYKESFICGQTNLADNWKLMYQTRYDMPEHNYTTRYPQTGGDYGWVNWRVPYVSADNKFTLNIDGMYTSSSSYKRTHLNATYAESKNIFFTGGTIILTDLYKDGYNATTSPHPYLIIDLGVCYVYIFKLRFYERGDYSDRWYNYFNITFKNKYNHYYSYYRTEPNEWSIGNKDLAITYDPKRKFGRLQYSKVDIIVENVEPFDVNSSLKIMLRNMSDTHNITGLCSFRDLIWKSCEEVPPSIQKIYPTNMDLVSPSNSAILWTHSENTPMIDLTDSRYCGEDLRNVAVNNIKNVTFGVDNLSDQPAVTLINSDTGIGGGTVVNGKILGSSLGDIEISKISTLTEGQHTLTFTKPTSVNYDLYYYKGNKSPIPPTGNVKNYWLDDEVANNNGGYWAQLTEYPIDPTQFDVVNLKTETAGDDLILVTSARLVDPWMGVVYLGNITLGGSYVQLTGGYNKYLGTVQLDNGPQFPLLPFWNSAPTWYKGSFLQKVYNENGECVVIDTRTATDMSDGVAITFTVTADMYSFITYPKPKIAMTSHFVSKYDSAGTVNDEDPDILTNDSIEFDCDGEWGNNVRTNVAGHLYRPPIQYKVERWWQDSRFKFAQKSGHNFTQPAFKVSEKAGYKDIVGSIKTTIGIRYGTNPNYSYAFKSSELPVGTVVGHNLESSIVAEHGWGFGMSNIFTKNYYWGTNSTVGGFVVLDLGEECYCNSLIFSSGSGSANWEDYRIKKIRLDLATSITDIQDYNDVGWFNLVTDTTLTVNNSEKWYVIRWTPSEIQTLLGTKKVRYLRLDITETHNATGWGLCMINAFPGLITATDSSSGYHFARNVRTDTVVAIPELIQADNREYELPNGNYYQPGFSTIRLPRWYYYYNNWWWAGLFTRTMPANPGTRYPLVVTQDFIDSVWIGRVKTYLGYYYSTGDFYQFYPGNWQIEYSNDGGTTWTIIRKFYGTQNTAGSYGIEDFIFEPVLCNKIRLIVFDHINTPYHPAIWLFTPYVINTDKGVFEYSIDGGKNWIEFSGHTQDYSSSIVSKNGGTQKLIRYLTKETIPQFGNWYYSVKTDTQQDSITKVRY